MEDTGRPAADAYEIGWQGSTPTHALSGAPPFQAPGATAGQVRAVERER